MEETWWHAPGGPRPEHPVPVEPEEAFRLRVAEFKAFLLARPETVIAVVAHWGLLLELTGHQFDNCEVKTFEMQVSWGGGLVAVVCTGTATRTPTALSACSAGLL
jgi:hypothetical protein